MGLWLPCAGFESPPGPLHAVRFRWSAGAAAEPFLAQAGGVAAGAFLGDAGHRGAWACHGGAPVGPAAHRGDAVRDLGGKPRHAGGRDDGLLRPERVSGRALLVRGLHFLAVTTVFTAPLFW